MPPPPPGLLVLGATAMQCPQRQSSETNRAAHSPQTEVEQPGALHCVRQPGHPDAAHRVQAPLPQRRQCSRLHLPHTARAAKHVLQYCESVDHGAVHPGTPRRSNRLARRAIMRTAGGSKPAPGCSSCCSLSPSTLKLSSAVPADSDTAGHSCSLGLLSTGTGAAAAAAWAACWGLGPSTLRNRSRRRDPLPAAGRWRGRRGWVPPGMPAGAAGGLAKSTVFPWPGVSGSATLYGRDASRGRCSCCVARAQVQCSCG